MDTDESPEGTDLIVEAEGDDVPTPEPMVTDVEETAESQEAEVEEEITTTEGVDATSSNASIETSVQVTEDTLAAPKTGLFENVLTAITQGPEAMDAFAAEHGYSLPEGPPYRKAKALAQWALD